jgi:hypothetical protein
MTDFVGDRIAKLASPLRAVAVAREVYAIVSAIGGIICGVILIARTEQSLGNANTTHPWAGAGIALAASALLYGAFVWFVARVRDTYLEQRAHGHA